MLNYRTLNFFNWGIALLLAAWLIHDLPLSTIFSSISDLTVQQWSLWLSLNLVIILVFVWRWLVLNNGLNLNLLFLDLLLLRQAGQSISFITPGPQFGGEPFQIFWLWKKFNIPPACAIQSVATDRFFELWVNFAVLLLGIFILIFSQAGLADWFSLALIILLIMLFLSLFAWALVFHRKSVSKRILKLAQQWLGNSRLSKIHKHIDFSNSGFQELLSDKAALVSALSLSVTGWLLTFVELYLVLGFFELYLDVGQFVLVLIAMRLAFLLPLPGGIGTLEAAVIWSFTVLELPITSAAALLALIRFRDLLMLGMGLFCARLLQTKAIPVGYD